MRWILICMAATLVATTTRAAEIDVVINRATQVMSVTIDGQAYAWPTSTGRSLNSTPAGTYSPQSLHERHFSSKYGRAPMPYSIFFNGDIAIHGTTEIAHLGRRASHGCVRLHPSNARILFEAVRKRGLGSARITVL